MTDIPDASPRMRAAVLLLPYLAFAFLLYVSYFILSRQFGLLSDDVFIFRRVQTLADVWYDVRNGYSWNPRVIGLTLHRLLTFLAHSSTSGYFLYLLCWVMLCAQSMLVFQGLKRYFPLQIAFLATCFFLLFPADASKYMPVHAFWTQFSAIGFWAALYLFSRDNYALAALSLVSTVFVYETHLLVGAALPLLPLLLKQWSLDKFAVRLIRYWFWLLTFMLVALFLRGLMPPGRLGGLMELSVSDLLHRLFDAVRVGVTSSTQSLISRPVDMWLEMDLPTGILAFSVAALLLLVLRYNYSFKMVRSEDPLSSVALRYAALISFGVVAFASSYLIYVAERFPPMWTESRLSNVHMAAGVGGTIIFATLLNLLLDLAGRMNRRLPVVVFLVACGYLATLSGYFYQYQTRLVDNWAYQLNFWKQFDQLVPDLTENTLVLVEDTIAENKKFEDPVLSWAFNFTLPLVRSLPAGWDEPPVVLKDYTAKYEFDNQDLYVSAHTVTRMRVDRVVVLAFGEAGLYRKTGVFELQGLEFDLTPQYPNSCCESPGPLLKFLGDD